MKEKSIVFDNKIPPSFKYKLIGYGTCGECYLTRNNEVYKRMFDQSLYEPIKDLISYQSDFISFPNTLVYYKYESKRGFRGYLMDFFDGKPLYDIDNLNILRFLNCMSLLESEIRRVSDEGVTFFDLNDRNILYKDDSGLKLIDTDLYETNLYKNKNYNYECNMIEFSKTIMNFIFSFQYLLFKNERINDLYASCGYFDKVKPSEFIYEFINFVNSEKKTDIKTLKQLRHYGSSYYKIL